MHTRAILVTAVAALASWTAVEANVSAAEPEPAAVVAAPTADPAPEYRPRPAWHRSCSWASCTFWLNRSETRIVSISGTGAVTLICAIIRNTPALVVCTAFSIALNAIADTARNNNQCIRFTVSRLFPVWPYNWQRYRDWRCT